jgi:hypothetical protein
MKLTIEIDNPDEALNMLQWARYYGACADIATVCRNHLKYQEDVPEKTQQVLRSIAEMASVVDEVY